MIMSQVVPVIVLAPFFVVIFGVGIYSKIIMAMIISFFPIYINFFQGYKGISKSIHDLAYINNLSIREMIQHIYIPLSLPSIMSGLKVGATLAVIGAIVAEFTGAKYGIGKNLFMSSIRLDPDLMMSSLFFAMFLGLMLFGIIKLIERHIGSWYVNN